MQGYQTRYSQNALLCSSTLPCSITWIIDWIKAFFLHFFSLFFIYLRFPQPLLNRTMQSCTRTQLSNIVIVPFWWTIKPFMTFAGPIWTLPGWPFNKYVDRRKIPKLACLQFLSTLHSQTNVDCWKKKSKINTFLI